MTDRPTLVDQALHLGEQIAAAIEVGAWERLSTLVKQRTRVAQRLSVAQEENADTTATTEARPDQLGALADQHERLSALLRERRAEVEGELAEVDRLKGAHDLYDAPSPPSRVLDARLAG